MKNLTVKIPVKVVRVDEKEIIVDKYVEKTYDQSNIKAVNESELEKLTDEPLDYLYYITNNSGVAIPNLFIKTPDQEIVKTEFTIEDLC